MIKLLSSLALIAALAGFGVGPALGADEVNVSRGATASGPGLAVHGYDVVAYFKLGTPTLGSDKFAIAYDGGTYRFANQANLDEFKAHSAEYAPACDGFCAYGVAHGKKFDGDPHFWKIVDGKLHLNLNGDIATEWNKDVPGNVAKAEGNWTKIRTVATDKL